jgi:hypothetical protein
MTQESEFVIIKSPVSLLAFNTLQQRGDQPPPVAASSMQHSHESFWPQYGQTHMQDSIRFPHRSQCTTSSPDIAFSPHPKFLYFV